MCINLIIIIISSHHHHHRHLWAAVVSRCWAKASACRLQVSLYCAVLCQIVSLQYLCRSSLHRLAGLPCPLLLSCVLLMWTREDHRPSLRWLMCPARDHFIFSHTNYHVTCSSCLLSAIYLFICMVCQCSAGNSHHVLL